MKKKHSEKRAINEPLFGLMWTNSSRSISDIPPRHLHFTKITLKNFADLTDGPSPSISGVNTVNPVVAFTTSMEERETYNSLVLSLTLHETGTYRCVT
jgi:hypothetical protein